MLGPPGENACSICWQQLVACTVQLEGENVHLVVVRGLSSCERFLSNTVQRCLDKCFESLVDKARNILMSTDEDRFSRTEAQFVTEGMNITEF